MKKLILFILFTTSIFSCGIIKDPVSKGDRYANIYKEKPLSIVIMPPINKTNVVDAKDYFYTSLYTPLVEKGYYVFPPALTMDVFQKESAYDSERFLDSNISIFKKVLGADAAMFTIIDSWEKNVLSGTVTVGIEYILRSTKTGDILYKRKGLISVDRSVNAGGSGLLGSLINLVGTALSTAMTDKIVAGRACNIYVLSDMPAGVYSPEYGIDIKELSGEPYIQGVTR